MTRDALGTSLDLAVHGPFRLVGSDDLLFSSPEGIYFWGVPWDDGLLIYYVGQTGRPFVERMREHVEGYLIGLYRLHEPVSFAKGERNLVWEGMWEPGTQNRVGEFLERYDALSGIISETLRPLRVMLIPIDGDARMRERVEAAIALHLRSQPGVVGAFQEHDIRYRPGREGERPIAVRFNLPIPIVGLPDELEVQQ